VPNTASLVADRPPLRGEPAPSPERSWGALVAMAVAAAGAIVFFTLSFGTRHFRVPWGDDTFFYVNALRLAGRFGLANEHLRARPAFPLLGATFSSVSGAGAWATTVALPFAMAASLGLACAAIGRRWGVRGWAVGAFAFLASVCAVSTRLAAGKSENLMLLWMLAAALAAAVWVRGLPRWVVGVPAALMLVGGLTEWPFLAAFVAVCAAAGIVDRLARRFASAAVPDDDRTSPDAAPGPAIALLVERGPGPTLGQLLLAALLALGATAVVVFLVNGTGPGDAVQQLPPTFRYALRLRGELRLIAPLATGAAFLAGWWTARRWSDPGLEPTRTLLTVWAVLTVGVVAFGLTGVRLPTYRALTFALPFTLGLAAAPFFDPAQWWPASLGRRVRGALRAAIRAGLVALVLIPSIAMWYRLLGPQTNPDDLGQIATAVAYAEAHPGDGPVVLVVNTRDVVRVDFYGRLVTALSPAGRTTRVLVYLGRAAAALRSEPTRFVDEGLDEFSVRRFEEVRPALEAGAPILVSLGLAPFDFRQAEAIGAPILGDDLAVLRGPAPPPVDIRKGIFIPLPPWWVMAGQAALFLALLALCGAGWSMALSPASIPRVARVALAPSFGGAILVVVALSVERGGGRPNGGGATVTLSVALAASLALVLWSLFAARRRGAALPSPDPPA
jgi:hypothetical protein